MPLLSHLGSPNHIQSTWPTPMPTARIRSAILRSSRCPLLLSSGLPGTDNGPTWALTQYKGGNRSAAAGEALLGSVGDPGYGGMMPRGGEDFSCFTRSYLGHKCDVGGGSRVMKMHTTCTGVTDC